MSGTSRGLPDLSPRKRELLERLREKGGLRAGAEERIPRRRDARPAPLSFGQQRLWFLDQLGPGSPAYVLSTAVRLGGQLDVAALEASLRAIVRRHEALRTTFTAEDGTPVQVVDAAPRVSLAVADLRATPEGEREAEARRRAAEEARRPFDLSRGPLFRPTLLRLGDADHVLLLTMHHIISDAWSMAILRRELDALYRAFTSGSDSPPLAELPIQAGDFAAWQRQWMQGEVLEEQVSYWRRRLDGASVLQLPTDRPRPVVPTFAGASRLLVLPAPLTKALKKLSQREGTTLFMTLLAAFQVLLHRYTGQDDVVVGSPIANRNRNEIEGLIGFFVNSLVLRGDLSGNPTFRDVLTRVREVALEAYAHQDLPFEKLVEELKPERNLGQNPLFQVVFALQNAPPGRLELPGIALSPFDMDVKVTPFDLEVHLFEHQELISAALIYDTDLFDARTVERMGGHYVRLLEGAVARPEARLSELPLLGPEEERLLLVEWNATRTEHARHAAVLEMFREQVARTPEALAVASAGEALSYRELDERSTRLALGLRSLGVGAESVVGVCTERSAEMVVGVLGIVKAGGAYLPLDPSHPPERLAFMLEDSKVEVLLTQEKLRRRLPVAGQRVISLDVGLGWPRGEGVELAMGEEAPERLAYVIYTSGSTGRPKGVELTHAGLVNLVLWHCREYDVRPGDRGTQVASPAFDASVWEVWPYLVSGASLHIPTDEVRMSPGRLVDWLGEEEITHSFLPTPLAEAMLREPRIGQLRLRYLLTGGDRLHRLEAGSLPFRLVNHYGPTEGTVVATSVEVEPGGEGEPPIGRPIDNTRAYVLDAHLRLVPSGVAGELCIGGEGVARGYLGHPELTAERFVPDPFSGEPGGRLYRTGDRVRHLPDGTLEFLGRQDQQVKVRGFRIELGEIESVLGQHTGVKDAVAMVREDAPGDLRLVAYATVRNGHVIGSVELTTHLKGKLPEHMVPSAVVVLDALPLGPNGKLDRRALPAPKDRRDAGRSFEAPRGELEETIAAVWREVLRLDRVGARDNFFDLGGHSLLLLRVHAKLRDLFEGKPLSVVDLFRHPTVQSLAKHLSRDEDGPREGRVAEWARGNGGPSEIAVIATAGRFPGASGVEEFWRNVRAGVESISFFSDGELAEAGVPRELLRDERYVKARGVLEGVELFDAGFFGYNPREAEVMDPQQRVFLETAWEALERAGYDAERYEGRVGVYAGVAANTYWRQLGSDPELLSAVGGFAALIGSDKDFLPTRVSYKLNLRGPSVAVQTACSTSLVAVHLACRSLIGHECDMALAGGVSIGLPQTTVYRYEAEGILSPDGHCRAFDARAQGTVGGAGAGIVVLKRLEDAVRDGDRVHAVIKGSAINNDGSNKVGYTAPGVEGQSDVIAMAQARARVEPGTIGYVEAHGTGTALGDPIEIAALTQAFRAGTTRTGFCAIGSVKTNVGHLDAAAGVTGLIKTVLSLEHGELPPSLHFEEPNPKIDFANSPFYVNTELREWKSDGAPRRAGVSSFGIGGTNAHVVVEEAPLATPSGPSRAWQLLLLSAKTKSALDEATTNLAAHLRRHAGESLADVAYTLQVGRGELAHRRVVTCREVGEAVEALEGRAAGRVVDGTAGPESRGVAFLFPGQGAQHANMGRGLYESEPVFRGEIDRCVEGLRGELGVDLRELLYPAGGEEEEAGRRLRETRLAQAGLFAVEYALAKLWMEWGVEPQAMIGHSVGEYVAACLAGVLTLEDALGLIATRGRLMQEVRRGSMLAVPLAEEELRGLLGRDLSLAAVNAPSQCVVSGPVEAVEGLEEVLAGRGVEGRRLHTSHAYHSGMMDEVLGPFAERVARVDLRPPRIPYVSNVTGTWIRAEEATDPSYWSKHLRQTVRFSDGVKELLSREDLVLLEVGPGQTLSGLVREHPRGGSRRVVVSSSRSARENRPDEEVLLGALGRLWLGGIRIDWPGYSRAERRRRVPLPTYPFERKRYWVEGPRAEDVGAPATPLSTGGTKGIADWFYRPTWSSSAPSLAEGPDLGDEACCWLVFLDQCGVGARLVERLEWAGRRVISVTAGPQFERREGSTFAIRPGEPADYEGLLRALRGEGAAPRRIVHLWSVADAPAPSPDLSLELGFYSLLFLAQALGNESPEPEVGITVVTSGTQEVSGEGLAHPARATILGPCRVVPQEYPGVRCRCVDLRVPEAGMGEGDVDRLLAECGAGGEPLVALRGAERWVPEYAPLRLFGTGQAVPLRDRGVYLITGGLGGIGFALARFLARTRRARLALLGRSEMPPPETWDGWLAGHDAKDPTSRRILRVRALEAEGAEILLLRGDVADRAGMEEAMGSAESRFGPIHGVIHTAGVPGGGMIARKTREAAERVLAPKVKGTLVLAEVLEGRHVDFVVLCSSLAAVFGGPGQVDYCAANAFLDAFARHRSSRPGPFVLSLNWDGWREVGMAVETELPKDLAALREARLAAGEGIEPADGAEAFARALGQPLSQLLVSTVELGPRLAAYRSLSSGNRPPLAPAPSAKHPRPRMDVPFVAPRDLLEKAVSGIWRDLLGFDRVGVRDSFFDLGGHSLLATRLVNRLRDTFHVPIRLESFFEAPTIEGLARALAAAEARPGRTLEIAQLVQSVEEMSEEELMRMLQASAEPAEQGEQTR